ncbi:hypothetical protein [Neobacillus sp. D3-1R]|uniref:hypothetical protein n=1 Tax=Neobacillus sp. D3-1R TaxID=3445778 RepID=UPI003F9EBFE0
MNQYEVTHMIIDDDFYGEESVTAEFSYDHQEYSITFKKEDLELLNAWIFEDGHSLPAKLTDNIIEDIREEIKKRI